MRKVIYILALALCCMGCTRREVIPDGVLADIFHDIILVNAYKTSQPFDNDSLQMYSPILDNYGYTVDDLGYTIGNFSKRKSARLSDVVERAITKLEVESKRHKMEVEILDSIDAIALRRSMSVVYSDSLIEMRKQADTVNTYIVIENIKQGDYSFSFDYLVDSVDKNNLSYRTMAWFERDGQFTRDRGKVTDEPKRFKQNSSYLTKRKIASLDKDIKAEAADDRLIIQLVEWRGDLRYEPYITIKNFEVRHTPPLESAVKQLYDKFLNIRIFAPSLYEPYNINTTSSKPVKLQATDSLLLSATSGDAN